MKVEYLGAGLYAIKSMDMYIPDKGGNGEGVEIGLTREKRTHIDVTIVPRRRRKYI